MAAVPKESANEKADEASNGLDADGLSRVAEGDFFGPVPAGGGGGPFDAGNILAR